MTREEFNTIADKFLDEMRTKLGTKRAEYAYDGDVFANFNKASRVRNRAREAIAFDYALKHFVSILDIIEAIDSGEIKFSDDLLLEKFTDFSNYLVLIYAMLNEEGVKRNAV